MTTRHTAPPNFSASPVAGGGYSGPAVRLNPVYPAPLPSAIGLPGVLTLRRYVHGQVKVTLASDVRARTRKCTLFSASESGISDPRLLDIEISESDRQQAKKRVHDNTPSNHLEIFRMRQVRQRPGYGALPRRRKFSAYAVTAIKEHSFVATQRYGLSGVFLTGTIPGSLTSIPRVVAEHSGYLMGLIRQWLRDRFGSNHAVCAVWELQSRGMLHIHICVQSDQKGQLQGLIEDWYRYWHKLLSDVSRSSGIDLFAKTTEWSWKNEDLDHLADAGWLRKEPARYLAKYLSKSSRTDATATEHHPSRWWSVDRATHNEAIQRRITEQLRGYSLCQLKGWFRNLVGFAEELTENVRQFTNPFYLPLPGFTAFFAEGDDFVFLSQATTIGAWH